MTATKPQVSSTGGKEAGNMPNKVWSEQGCVESAKGPHPTVPQLPCLGIHPDLELPVIGCWKRQVGHHLEI